MEWGRCMRAFHHQLGSAQQEVKYLYAQTFITSLEGNMLLNISEL